jgi:hypothetical protein
MLIGLGGLVGYTGVWLLPLAYVYFSSRWAFNYWSQRKGTFQGILGALLFGIVYGVVGVVAGPFTFHLAIKALLGFQSHPEG